MKSQGDARQDARFVLDQTGRLMEELLDGLGRGDEYPYAGGPQLPVELVNLCQDKLDLFPDIRAALTSMFYAGTLIGASTTMNNFLEGRLNNVDVVRELHRIDTQEGVR